MNLNSPLFDRIRVRRTAEEAQAPAAARCDHPGCGQSGLHRAPKGRGQEGKYWLFCLDHVRAYNQSYNYFAGMSDEAVQAYQKDASTGHRPTWAMGVNGAAQAAHPGHGTEEARPHDFHDPLGLFGAAGFGRRPAYEEPRPRVSPIAQKALDTLGLDEAADAAAVKARYKLLVKRFHPDANGGDRTFEARLQEILRAYNTLKSLGRA